MKKLILMLSVLLPFSTALALEEASGVSPAPAAEVGRYQLFESQFFVTTVNGPQTPEKHMLRIDTATGEVWIGKQTQYMDKKSGKLVQQRYWEPFEHYLEAIPPAPAGR